jgi:hypothetical protein
METCSNCRWWKDAELVARISKSVAALPARYVPLGYCGPWVGSAVTGRNEHHGLTAEDYSCGEWKERGDD